MANEFIARNGLIALDNSIVTGSLTVTNGITGSLFGTASWALNAITASISTNAISASFASTASSADDFLVRGTLTAQTIVAQTITSSTDFITGSTRFGSLLSNTHQFTGSVSVTGSLSVNNVPVVVGTGSNGQVSFWTGTGTQSGSNNLFWDDANGRLGIGTNTPANTLSITPPANTTALGISGYSLTGANAQPALDISGTWNTTGTPTLIRANVTDTASNAFSTFMSLQVGGTQRLAISKGGAIAFGSSTTSRSNIGPASPIFGTGTTDGEAIYIGRGLITGAGYGIFLVAQTGQRNPTSGVSGHVRIRETFNPTSGTATYDVLTINNVINQTGTASGITRGLLVNPELTSAADWRSIEWNNNTGFGLYGSGSANNTIQGSLLLGALATPTARLQVRGAGATSATTTLLVQNSTPTTLMTILDNGQFAYNTPTMSLATTGSAYTVNLNVSQSALVGAQVYGVNITPTFFATTGSQTQTALRVNAVFTGSAVATSGSNIIADFGSTSAGSQLTVTDITSGSIYMVNDVSGLPIIEATSDWTVNMYDFPNRVFRKTGSAIELGFPSTSSVVTFFADTILNEGLGFTYRTTQVSGSTVGAVTSSIWNINFGAVSSSVYVNAVVTGFDTGSRDTITGDIKATIRYRSGVASIVGFNQSFSNTDNAAVGFNIVAGSTSGSLQVFGTGSRAYQWGATITTQVI